MAVLTGLRQHRTTIRAGRTGQRVRLSVAITTAQGDVFNLSERQGFFARVSQRLGSQVLSWSPYGAPPYTHEQSFAFACENGRFCWDVESRLRFLCDNGGLLEERMSDDAGLTWNDPVTRFAAGAFPDIALGRSGTILRAAYVAGTIQGTEQASGDANPGVAFTFKDAASVNLAAQNDSFRLAEDRNGWWWLHARISGGTTTLLYSDDQGRTWSTTGGAVTGIGSGSHPGLLAVNDGTLYAWAYVAGAGKITRREPGDTAWSTPATITDDAAVNLSLADAAFSLAEGIEGPGRLILSVVIAGESAASDWYGARDGTRFRRF